MAFLCQYILNINCLWKFLSKIVLFIAYLGFLLSRTVSIPIISSRTQFATLTPWCQVKLNTCEPELEMFTRYSKLLAGYMRGVGTDLTTDVSPPKCLYIEVRAVTSSIFF